MSSHWQMKKPMWAIEIVDGFHDGSLYGSNNDATLFFRRTDAASFRRSRSIKGRIVKVKVKYEEIKK